ncbi:MAG: hypothetical protein Kow0062_18450 [Acidobacteriota bacterium]
MSDARSRRAAGVALLVAALALGASPFAAAAEPGFSVDGISVRVPTDHGLVVVAPRDDIAREDEGAIDAVILVAESPDRKITVLCSPEDPPGSPVSCRVEIPGFGDVRMRLDKAGGQLVDSSVSPAEVDRLLTSDLARATEAALARLAPAAVSLPASAQVRRAWTALGMLRAAVTLLGDRARDD